MSKEFKKRLLTSFFLFSLLMLMFLYTYILIISILVIAIIAWIEFYGLILKIFKKENQKNKILRFFYKSISLLYLILLIYFILASKFSNIGLEIFIIYSILVSVMSDIGGLLVGKTFKGKKLTKISPKKTISGSIGSFIFSLSLIPLFFNKLIEYDFLILTLVTILISLTSQLGDLFISYLKRKAKVKNTSDILPGHGGFLDRVDGIIFAIPIGILLFNFF